jgi:hypothetical protein
VDDDDEEESAAKRRRQGDWRAIGQPIVSEFDR